MANIGGFSTPYLAVCVGWGVFERTSVNHILKIIIKQNKKFNSHNNFKNVLVGEFRISLKYPLQRVISKTLEIPPAEFRYVLSSKYPFSRVKSFNRLFLEYCRRNTLVGLHVA